MQECEAKLIHDSVVEACRVMCSIFKSWQPAPDDRLGTEIKKRIGIAVGRLDGDVLAVIEDEFPMLRET